MQKKTINKNLLLLLIPVILIIWNIGYYSIMANTNFGNDSIYVNHEPGEEEFGINIDAIIDPPLGNNTQLEPFTAVFSNMVQVLPIEITIVFLAEVVLGNALGLDQKKFKLKRLGIMLGAACALSVVIGVVNYTLIYPAMHDIPIHTKTFVQPGTGTNETNPEVLIPQYGSSPTFFSYGVDIILMIVASIIIVGVHFPAFRFIQGFKNITAGVSLIFPAIIYPVIWGILLNQETARQYEEQLGQIWTITLIIGLGFIFVMLAVLVWKLSLIGTAPKGEEELEKAIEK